MRGKTRRKLIGSKRRVVRRTRKPPIRVPTTARQYFAMSQKEQETWDSIGHTVTSVRIGRSLTKAARQFEVSRDLVIELARPALRKRKGRYVATRTDRLLRVVTVLGVRDKKTIATRDSRQASLVGGHWAAVQKYLQTGDYTGLLKFKNKSVIDANGKRHRLLTNLEELNRRASAGVLSFESMYAGGAR